MNFWHIFSIDNFFEWIVAAIIGAIITAVLTFIWKKMFPRRKCLTYKIDSTTLMNKQIDRGFEHIDIQFKGKEIEELTVTKIIVWNSGTAAIREEDIAPKDPLHIYFKDADILNRRFIKISADSNNLSAVLHDTEITFGFDYLEKREGFVYEVIHTGTADNTDLTVKIIDQKKGLYKENVNKDNKKDLIGLCIAILAIATVSAVIDIYFPYYYSTVKLTCGGTEKIVTGTLTISYIINLIPVGITIGVCLIAFFSGLYLIFKGRTPSALQ